MGKYQVVPVKLILPEGEPGTLSGAFFITSQNSVDSQDEFFNAEGLGDVVIRTHGKPRCVWYHFGNHIRESAISVVAVQMRVSAVVVDREEIGPAVTVEVDPVDAQAVRARAGVHLVAHAGIVADVVSQFSRSGGGGA